MNDFLKTIKISFDTDRQSVDRITRFLKDIQDDASINFKLDKDALNSMQELTTLLNEQAKAAKDLGRFKEVVSKGIISNDAAKSLNEQLNNIEDLEEEIERVTDLIEQLSNVQSDNAKQAIKDLNEYLKTLKDSESKMVKSDSFEGLGFQKGGLLDSIKTGSKLGIIVWGINQLGGLFNKFVGDIKSLFKEAWSELKQTIDYSQMTNPQLRNQALAYGFNPAQNYAYSKTMQMMGFSSFDDLYFMNAQERSKFQEKFVEYQDRYIRMYDSGFFKDLQNYEWEMTEFKEDLTYDVMQWLVDNKDTLKNLLLVLTDFAKGTLEALGWLLDAFSSGRERTESERRASVLDIINNHSNVANSTSVKIDNTFNNVDSKDRTWLANAGAMTYEQIIQALT